MAKRKIHPSLIEKEVPKTPEEQWVDWQENNKTVPHVDTATLKTAIIDGLSFVSKMDVKEYTLYQKWCEVKEKFEVEEVPSGLFGPATFMSNEDQRKKILDIKSRFWLPSDPDEFSLLEPKMVLYNGDEADTWNTLRTFASTMKNNSNIGRNLYYIVEDNRTGCYLGVVCISSDFLDLTPRDQAIGWPRTLKTQGNMINHTAIGSTIVPIQPLGYNYMGGKLLALLCLSDTVQRDWKERYGDTLVGVTTTSLYGNTKTGGMSQYDGLEHWNKMGFSAGSVAFEPDRSVRNLAFAWIRENYPKKYFEWWEAKNPQGLPLKRDHKNRSLNFVYSKLGIPKELTKSAHQRGIYFSPLYINSFEYLRGEIDDSKLVKAFDTSEKTLSDIWKTKYAKGRISMLKKKGKVSTESLFYDDLIFLSWEETKAKYLVQVGR
jgi:hypothetical protein